ncbi:hypothetical protein VP1G_04858 [Cytospora mali]|uniref:Uncharacterized protein n=1 Tax=Cytospora mali TaxID=578113 RepID=A0A194V0R1_CYTMA|nr:hypothetical protein VP1G_04858 [Valsa mali var. pyri (nom. inval.)]
MGAHGRPNASVVSRTRKTNTHPTMQELASGLSGIMGDVPVPHFTSIILAGNVARQRRELTRHKRQDPVPGQRTQVVRSSGDLLSERLALARLGLSLDGTPSRALEAGWNGGGSEEDSDKDESVMVYSHQMTTPTHRDIEDGVHTAQAVMMQRVRVGGRLRRQGKFSLPLLSSLDRVDNQVDDVERHWGRASVTGEKVRTPIVAGDMVAASEELARFPGAGELLKYRISEEASRRADRRQYSAYKTDARAIPLGCDGEGPNIKAGKRTRKTNGVGIPMLTENRNPISMSLERALHPEQNQGTALDIMANMEEEEVLNGAPNTAGDPMPTVLIPGRANFSMAPLSDLAPATDHDEATTVSFGPGYIDDNKYLFFPPSAAQNRARANTVFIPALPDSVIGQSERDMSSDGSASSLSLVPTVFDVRVPTPTPRTVRPADDRGSILPSAQRHTRQTFGGGGMNNNKSSPPTLRRSRDRPAATSGGPRPSERRALAPTGREFASAMAAFGAVVESPVPDVLVPGLNVPRPPPPAHLAPERHDEAGSSMEDDEWSSGSERGSWYGGCPGAPAPGDDWKSRWMRYEGNSFR